MPVVHYMLPQNLVYKLMIEDNNLTEGTVCEMTYNIYVHTFHKQI